MSVTMLRIVGVQRSETPDKEFILFQNQGSMRINLRGHVVMSDSAIESGNLYSSSHVFSDDIFVAPGLYVVLGTGVGVARWSRTKDGANVYHAYMNQERPLWNRLPGSIHIMQPHHTYVERVVESVLLR